MKNKKNIWVMALFAVVVVLIFINRNSVKKQEEMADAKQLQIIVNNEEKVYYYSEESDKYTTFDTQMRRRNGDVFEKNYSGIQLKDILADMDISVTETTTVSGVCADQYEVQFTYDEIMAEGNVYIITQESGRPLAEDSGSFMLVVNNDEFSTRWAKNVVQVKISEK
ncbi:MAG: molybdopterin-dependent oxidoreductase [Oscillospiraceae bacterium]|nr:molybdopterin-dependent oxidoreductase [Oscillospiraceae bacterium]